MMSRIHLLIAGAMLLLAGFGPGGRPVTIEFVRWKKSNWAPPR
jgi:hypothetical protein